MCSLQTDWTPERCFSLFKLSRIFLHFLFCFVFLIKRNMLDVEFHPEEYFTFL